MSAMKELYVLLNGQRIGVLSQDNHGRHAFQYDTAVQQGTPLSLSMPVRAAEWTGDPIEAYIDGLLPDSWDVRKRIGLLYGVNPNNPFTLLSAIGLDCGGAVQFVTAQQFEELPLSGSWKPIDEQVISERLQGAKGAYGHSWQENDERWSLNGAQEKIALAYAESRNQWYEAQGAAATTHIIKPGIDSSAEQAFNEYFCMRMIARLGLSASVSSYEEFNGTGAVISRRWDRDVYELPIGSKQPLKVNRIHQEDFCQAIGIRSANKYQNDGGPGAPDIVRFMRDNGFAESSIDSFYSALVVNYLLCGTDAHAKNYAILERENQRPILAPLYDIASMYPYETYLKQTRKLKMAMKIGDEYRWKFIDFPSWRKLAQQCGDKGSEERITDKLREYAKTLPDVFANVGNEERLRLILTKNPDDANSLERLRTINAIGEGLIATCAEVGRWFA